MIVMKIYEEGQQEVLSNKEQKKLAYNRRIWFIKRKYNCLTRDLFNVWEHNKRSINNQTARVKTLIKVVSPNERISRILGNK
tara:strand:- start:20488 stop:20733 length:246 start_codon:yes stop_codon:yes gene_type:complete